ncbi:hypothetical protein EVAR_5897_1 [Eumeta japonica]|uniref:Uncharacterized protein n=1 Tax=Eumeta variegata TaxID=151549 RepID=A0A4C1TD79_EUMVA|nr:hypothetical protein EVAR_5897_1 [Eumeta japonica]
MLESLDFIEDSESTPPRIRPTLAEALGTKKGKPNERELRCPILPSFPSLHSYSIQPTPPSIRYPIPSQEGVNALLTPLGLQMSMGGDNHLPSLSKCHSNYNQHLEQFFKPRISFSKRALKQR